MPHNACMVTAPTADRRSATRAATVFTIGKIGIDRASRPCMVRDISEGGLRIQMASPPPLGAGVDVEMRGLAQRRATVRWVDGRDAGLAFDEPCDLVEVFEARSNRTGQRARPPRFDLNHPIELLVGKRTYVGGIVNISVGGGRLTLRDPVAQGSHGVLRLNLGLAFDRVAGEVRWAADGLVGFRFTQPISSLSLARALEAFDAAPRPASG